jgi:DNA-directed RNA polymerase I subunit RPA2
MKTTTPRKLLPDSWGFLCPVHTPDGSPCGLLNHISSSCEIITHEMVNRDLTNGKIIETCILAGMSGLNLNSINMNSSSYDVILDGKVIGYVKNELITNFINFLRNCKVNKKHNRKRYILRQWKINIGG